MALIIPYPPLPIPVFPFSEVSDVEGIVNIYVTTTPQTLPKMLRNATPVMSDSKMPMEPFPLWLRLKNWHPYGTQPLQTRFTHKIQPTFYMNRYGPSQGSQVGLLIRFWGPREKNGPSQNQCFKEKKKTKNKKQKHTVVKGINNVKFQGVPSTWYKPQTQALFKSNNLDPQAEWGDCLHSLYFPRISRQLRKPEKK